MSDEPVVVHLILDGKTVAEAVRREDAQIAALQVQAVRERAEYGDRRELLRANLEVGMARLSLAFACERRARVRGRIALRRLRRRRP